MSNLSLEAIISITNSLMGKLTPEISKLFQSYTGIDERSLTYLDYIKLADTLEKAASRLNDEQKLSLTRIAKLCREKGQRKISDELFDIETNIQRYLDKGQVKDAVSLFNKAVDLGEVIKDHSSSYYISNKFAQYFLAKSDFTKATAWFTKALDFNPYDIAATIGLSYALFRDEKPEQALSVIDKVINLSPDNAAAWTNKGIILMYINKTQEALDAFEKGIELDSTYPLNWLSKAMLLKTRGKFKESISCYKKYLELVGSPDADVLNDIGNIYLYSLKDHENAEKYYRKALKINQNHKFSLYNLGIVYSQKEKWDKAIEYLNKAIEIDQTFSNALFEKALIYESKGDFEQALACYKKVTEIDPKTEETSFNLGYSLYRLGEYEEALRAYERAIEYKEDYLTWYNKALCLEQLGNHQEAIESYKKAIDLQPEYLAALTSLVRLLESNEKYEEAIGYLDRITKIEPKDPDMWNWEGNIYKDYLGKQEEAIKCYKQAIEADPQYKYAWYNMGQTYLALEKSEDALEAFDEAIKIDPNYRNPWYWKAKTEERKGEFKKALKSYQKSDELDPNDTSGLFGMAYSLGELGKYRESNKIYSKILRKDRGDKASWVNKGRNYALLKKYEEAIKCYDRALEIDSDYSPALVGNGVALQNLGREGEALEYHERVITMNQKMEVRRPDLSAAWANKSLILKNQHKYEESLAAVEKALELVPSYVFALNVKGALLFDHFNKIEEAYDCFQHASELAPENQDILVNLPEILTVLERHDEAINKLNEILELDLSPYRQIVMHFMLFANLLFIDKEKEARNELTEILRLYRANFMGKKVDWDFLGFRQFLEAKTSRYSPFLLKLVDLFECKITFTDFRKAEHFLPLEN